MVGKRQRGRKDVELLAGKLGRKAKSKIRTPKAKIRRK